MNLAEETFYRHLPFVESMAQIMRMDVDAVVLPTELMHPVWHWAKEYYLASGMTMAPSAQAMLEQWGRTFADVQFRLDLPSDSITWAVEKLNSMHVYAESVNIQRDMARSIANASDAARPDEVVAFANRLNRLARIAQSSTDRVDVSTALPRINATLHDRLTNDATRGITFGTNQGTQRSMGLIDFHTRGIQPGELGVLVAPTKVGKSWMVIQAAISCIERGVPVSLFTLENNTTMTLDRIACFACHVNYTDWQDGVITVDQHDQVREWIETIPPDMFHVISPSRGSRTFESLIANARSYGSKAVMIDQLSFVHYDGDQTNKHHQYGEMLHDLKDEIQIHPALSVLLTHQINREGTDLSRNQGELSMTHIADASEIERTADWVFGLHGTADEMLTGLRRFDVLAVRRKATQKWQLDWSPEIGLIDVIGPRGTGNAPRLVGGDVSRA